MRRIDSRITQLQAQGPSGICNESREPEEETIDSCIIQLKAQGPSRTCNESKGEEEEWPSDPPHRDQKLDFTRDVIALGTMGEG